MSIYVYIYNYLLFNRLSIIMTLQLLVLIYFSSNQICASLQILNFLPHAVKWFYIVKLIAFANKESTKWVNVNATTLTVR